MVSVDGFFAGADGNIDWHRVDEEFNEYAIELLNTVDTIILGRVTYQLFEGYWPAALTDPKTSKNDREIARLINEVTKIVFSRTLEKTSWKNTQVLHDIVPEEIKKLKEQSGGDIVIYGSGTIVQALARLGVIDEYRLFVAPVILGNGKPLFRDKMNLKLLETRKFTIGNVLLRYQPIK